MNPVKDNQSSDTFKENSTESLSKDQPEISSISNGMKTNLFTIKQAAEQVGLSTRTLKRYEERGLVTPQRTPGDQRRYTQEHVESLLQNKNGNGTPPAPPAGGNTQPPVLPAKPRTHKLRRFILTLLLLLLLLGSSLYIWDAYRTDLNTKLANLKNGIEDQLVLLDQGKANLQSNSFSGDINLEKDLKVAQTITTKDLIVTDTGRVSFLTVDNELIVLNGPVVLPAGSIENLELANSSLTYDAGSGLSGGGLVPLGGLTTFNIGAGTGISVGANDISVLYGSTAGTAVQGNQSIGVTAGTNLSGGGSLTLGNGGTLTLNTISNPTFSTSVTTPLLTSTGALSLTPGGALTIGATGQTLTLQGSATTLSQTSGGYTSTLGFTTPTATRTINLPDASGDICLTTGNCAGLGGTISGSGTTNRIAKFNSASGIGNSSINDLSSSLAMTIDESGNVGIGTTAPAYKLDVSGGTGIVGQFSGRVIGGNAVNSNEFTTKSQLDALTSGTAGAFIQNGNSFGATAVLGTNDANDLQLETGGTTKLTVQNSTGNVGIGTTAPGSLLEVSGALIPATIKSSNNNFVLNLKGNGAATGAYLGSTSTGALLFANSGGVENMRIDTSGNVGIGTATPGAPLEISNGLSAAINLTKTGAGAGQAQVYNDGNLHILAPVGAAIYNRGDVQLFTNRAITTEYMRINPSGNVGIGTTSPGAKLNVSSAYTSPLDSGIRITGTNPALALESTSGSSRNFSLINGYNLATSLELLYSAASGGTPTLTALNVDGSTGFIGLGSPVVAANRLDVNGSLAVGGSYYAIAAPTNGAIIQGNVGIGTTTPAYKLDVAGGTGIVGQFSGRVIGGNAVNTNEFATLSQVNSAASGTNFIQNGTAIQTNANFAIQSAAAGSVGGVIRGAASQTADLLQIQDSTGAVLQKTIANGHLRVQPAGIAALIPDYQIVSYGTIAASVGPSSTYINNSSTYGILQAFDHAAGLGQALAINPNGGNVGIGTTTPGVKLDVAGDTRILNGNRLYFQNAAGDANAIISNNGASAVSTLYIQAGNGVTINGPLTTIAAAASQVAATVQGAASQTGDLQQWQNSSGTVLARVDASGNGFFNNGAGGTGAAFVQGGNSFGAIANLGTNDAFNLNLRTGGTSKLTIVNSNGNVGIGTTAPLSKLDIRGTDSGSLAGTTSLATVNISSTNAFGANVGPSLQFSGDNGTLNPFGFGAIKGAKEAAGAGFAGYLAFYTTPAGSVQAERVRIDSTGNVGIGTTAPTYRLSTLNSVSTAGSAVSAITNTSTTDSANTVTLRLNTGAASTTTNARFVTFYAGCTAENCAGTAVGNISVNNGNVAYNTGGADFAERMPVAESTEAGDVVGVSPSGNRKAQSGDRILGVVSDSAGFIGGDKEGLDKSSNPVVGILGQIRTKVIVPATGIKKGDLLTVSATPGVAQRATHAGEVLGTALEDINGSGIQKVLILVRPGWYMPTVALNDDGTITDSTPTPDLGLPVIEVANGTKETQETNGASVSSEPSVSSGSARLDDLGSIVASHSGDISSLNSDLSNLKLKTENIESTLNLLASGSATLNSTQSASSAAELSLDKLDSKDVTISNTLSVLGRTTLGNVGITGKLNMGLLSINGLDSSCHSGSVQNPSGTNGSDPGAAQDDTGCATINTIQGPLKLQSDGFNEIDILNGKVVISANGDIKTQGEITVKKLNVDDGTPLDRSPSNEAGAAGASIGEGIMKSGESKIEIKTNSVTDKSKIFITPKTLTSLPLSVTSQADGKSFTVEMDSTLQKDIKFNWWIVN